MAGRRAGSSTGRSHATVTSSSTLLYVACPFLAPSSRGVPVPILRTECEFAGLARLKCRARIILNGGFHRSGCSKLLLRAPSISWAGIFRLILALHCVLAKFGVFDEGVPLLPEAEALWLTKVRRPRGFLVNTPAAEC